MNDNRQNSGLNCNDYRRSRCRKISAIDIQRNNRKNMFINRRLRSTKVDINNETITHKIEQEEIILS